MEVVPGLQAITNSPKVFVDLNTMDDALRRFYCHRQLATWGEKSTDGAHLHVQIGTEGGIATLREASGPDVSQFAVLHIEEANRHRFFIMQLWLLENEDTLVKEWRLWQGYTMSSEAYRQLTQAGNTICFLGPIGPQIVQRIDW